MLRSLANACMVAAALVGLGAVSLWIVAVAIWSLLIIDQDVAERDDVRRQVAQTNVARAHRARVANEHMVARSVAAGPAAPTEPEETEFADDPLLDTLAQVPAGTRMVMFELNALRHSVAGEATVACLSPNLAEVLSISEAIGIDLLEIFDRMAVIEGGGQILSGHFDALSRLPPNYGDRARIFGADGDERWAVWNGELVIFEDSHRFIERTVDRLEGRAESPDRQPLPELFGEILFRGHNPAILNDLPVVPGVAPTEFSLDGPGPELDPALAPRMRELFGSDPIVTLQISAMNEVALHVTVPWQGDAPSEAVAMSGTWRDHGETYQTQSTTQWHDGEMTVDWNLPREFALDLAGELCREMRGDIDESLAEEPFLKLLLGTAAMPPDGS